MTAESHETPQISEATCALSGFVALAIMMGVLALLPSPAPQAPVITPLVVRWETPPVETVDRLEFDPTAESLEQP